MGMQQGTHVLSGIADMVVATAIMEGVAEDAALI